MKTTRQKNLFLFYFSITLTILSSALYHYSAKSTPANINFPIALVVTYSVALGITIISTFFFPSQSGLAFELKQLNWASFLLGISIVGIEFGFLLTYRAGWNIGIVAILTNVTASLILVPIAIFIFKDKLSWINMLGIFVCVAGLVMLNWKK